MTKQDRRVEDEPLPRRPADFSEVYRLIHLQNIALGRVQSALDRIEEFTQRVDSSERTEGDQGPGLPKGHP